MQPSIEEKRQELIRAIQSLPEDLQSPMIWLIDHYDFAERMCRTKPLSEAERSALQEQVEEQNNAWMRVLLAFERVVNREE